MRILRSHITAARTAGRIPAALVISDLEAGRCGIGDATSVLAIPVERDNGLRIGRARLRLADGTRYEFMLPVYFTGD